MNSKRYCYVEVNDGGTVISNIVELSMREVNDLMRHSTRCQARIIPKDDDVSREFWAEIMPRSYHLSRYELVSRIIKVLILMDAPEMGQ